MIKPTVGRVVLYTPPSDDPILAAYQAPFKADVIYVWGDQCVNLSVSYPNGEIRFVSSATLVQEGDTAPAAGRYAAWPDRIGQAKKYEFSFSEGDTKSLAANISEYVAKGLKG